VSHGYLVFIPDMHFTQGQWGPSTVNSVDGAARYLKTLPYVDGKRLGATGHSNSGRFGFYLLSHSTSFAAMCVGEGTTNIISAGLGVGLLGDGESMLEWAEQRSTGTGLGMLWKNKATWLDHSAVLHADKVTSPLLLFDNKDGLLSDQAAELFTALRRLEKKTWWVHYDHGGHAMGFPLYLKDFTLRFTQFFDHYLKGAPAPRWMTQGIPNNLKGIESRYELDPKGSCGMDCKVCNPNK
jgi:dipeptidyl aminopeptidase/acylaminoacyl peptidase